MSDLIPSVDVVTRHVERLVSTGKLGPCDQLPGEYEMSRLLSVSRAVVREAYGGLKARGILVIIPGKGTFVSKQFPGSLEDLALANTVSNDEVSEVRWHLESINCLLAASRRTDWDLKRLRDVLEESRQITDPEEWVKLDSEFHVRLAEATHNKILAKLSRDIRGLQFEQSRKVSYQPGQIEAANEEHEEIVKAVESKDAVYSVQMIQCHLTRIQQKSQMNPKSTDGK